MTSISPQDQHRSILIESILLNIKLGELKNIDLYRKGLYNLRLRTFFGNPESNPDNRLYGEVIQDIGDIMNEGQFNHISKDDSNSKSVMKENSLFISTLSTKPLNPISSNSNSHASIHQSQSLRFRPFKKELKFMSNNHSHHHSTSTQSMQSSHHVPKYSPTCWWSTKSFQITHQQESMMILESCFFRFDIEKENYVKSNQYGNYHTDEDLICLEIELWFADLDMYGVTFLLFSILFNV